MRTNRTIWCALASCAFLTLVMGPTCPDLEDALGQIGASDTDGDAPPANLAQLSGGASVDLSGKDSVDVVLRLSAKVTTSLGGGIDGAYVEFVAKRYYWDAYEEEWIPRGVASSIHTTTGIFGLTIPAWEVNCPLYEGETVFISAAERETGNKQELQYTYTQAKESLSEGTYDLVEHRFELEGGV